MLVKKLVKKHQKKNAPMLVSKLKILKQNYATSSINFTFFSKENGFENHGKNYRSANIKISTQKTLTLTPSSACIVESCSQLQA